MADAKILAMHVPFYNCRQSRDCKVLGYESNTNEYFSSRPGDIPLPLW